MRKSRFSEEKIIGMLHSRLEVGRGYKCPCIEFAN